MRHKTLWRSLLLLPIYLLSTALPFLMPAGLNLEYEYALYSSLLALLLIPTAALWLPSRFLPLLTEENKKIYAPQVPAAIFWNLLLAPALAMIPALAMFWSGECGCSQAGFAFWLAILWYPAWVLSHAGYHGLLRARCNGLTRGKLLFIYFGILLVVGIYLVFELWTNPQKRLTTLIGGFLHGPIYDDLIAVDAGIVLARTSHLLLGLALLFAAWTQRQTAMIIATIILMGGFAITTGLSLHYPSTTFGKEALNRLLPQTLESEGFTIHYRLGPSDKLDTSADLDTAEAAANTSTVPLKIRRLQRDALFHTEELSAILKAGSTEPLPHVQIYVYPSEEKKKLWFGGGSTDVTDVYTPSIHITASSWPHPTLRHELVHALSSGMGFHGLGFHPNMAFTEGLAMALAPSPQTLSLHEGAAAVLASGKLKDVKSLFSPAFWRVSGNKAYTVAGSLIQYLIEKHGFQSVRSLYQGHSWEDATKSDEEAILEAWRAFLKPLYDPARQAIFTEALFRYPGILEDLCPHSKVDLRQSRDESVYMRLRQPVGWNPDEDYLPWLLNLAPGDQEARLRGWRKEIKTAVSDRFTTTGRLTTWRETLKKARKDPPETLEDVEMGLLESDLASILGDEADGFQLLTHLRDEGSNHYFGESLTRELEARQKIDREAGLNSDQIIEWRKFLAGWRSTIPETKRTSWITSYLQLRNAKASSLGRAELIALLGSEPDASISRSFHVEWFKLIAFKLMQEEAYQEAAQAYKKAKVLAPSGQQDVLLEHARRAAFYSKAGPLKATAPIE